MMLNVKTDYEIRVLMLLAVSKEPVSRQEISRQMEIPEDCLGDILGELCRSGTVSIMTDGGCCLAKNPDEITVWQTLEELESKAENYPQTKENPRVRRLHENVKVSMANVLNGVTLENLVNQM